MSPPPPERSQGEAAPDLSGVDTWLFDLDNTLYPHDVGVLARVEARILEYFVRLTGLPAAEAWALQTRYFDAHGSAVPGLVIHHDVDPHDFLSFAHDVHLDDLVPDARLRDALQRLPGRRLVFTNGSARHAERVLEKLGLADLFEDVFHAEAADLVAKPDPRAFERLIRRHDVRPHDTAFFEDRAVNLRPAARLGMTTVLVGPEAEASTDAFVHHRTGDLARFLLSARLREPDA